MKKLLVIFFIIPLLFSCIACSDNENKVNSTNIKLQDSVHCRDASIKCSLTDDMSASYYITPQGFDWDKLEEMDYIMKITITYNVYYKKDWSIGLGYKGSPKYEVSVVNSDGMGKMYNNLTTTTTVQTKTISLVLNIVDIKDNRLILTFSTDNIQNRIYFKNIRVDYRCYR